MAAKKFKFPLESVLTLRKHETDSARETLAQCIQNRIKEEERATSARRRLDELVASQTMSGPIDPISLRTFDAFRKEAQATLEDACRRLQNLKEVEQNAREILLARKQEEEALKILYEEQHEAFRKDQQADEMAFLDEQAISRMYRKRREPQA